MSKGSPAFAELLCYNHDAVSTVSLISLLRNEIVALDAQQFGAAHEVVRCINDPLVGIDGIQQICVVRHDQGARTLRRQAIEPLARWHGA